MPDSEPDAQRLEILEERWPLLSGLVPRPSNLKSLRELVSRKNRFSMPAS